MIELARPMMKRKEALTAAPTSAHAHQSTRDLHNQRRQLTYNPSNIPNATNLVVYVCADGNRNILPDESAAIPWGGIGHILTTAMTMVL